MDLFLKECPILLTSAMVGEREREEEGERKRRGMVLDSLFSVTGLSCVY